MKSQTENPSGLHRRYVVQKTSGEPVDPRARYFVLRFDNHGDDPKHIAACQKAMLTYAREIAPHMPQLALEIQTEIAALTSRPQVVV